MASRFCLALALAASASCGAGKRSQDPQKALERTSGSALALTSQAFEDGHPIPEQYSCDGADRAPLLHWSKAPAQTKSFALVVEDPDAPGGTFRHWGIFDIPASARSVGATAQAGTEVANDFGKKGYGGPCPPKGDRLHHYHFRLFALDTDRFEIAPNATVEDVERTALRHAIGEGELVGTYKRP